MKQRNMPGTRPTFDRASAYHEPFTKFDDAAEIVRVRAEIHRATVDGRRQCEKENKTSNRKGKGPINQRLTYWK